MILYNEDCLDTLSKFKDDSIDIVGSEISEEYFNISKKRIV